MDFHTLNRRQLQALCKKNNIPANLTNLAMALSLQALPTVQGVEELPLQQPPESSTESPAKPQAASLSVPRTAARGTATTRRKATVMVQEDESETTLHPSTRSRRSTRGLPVAAAGGDVPQTPLRPGNVAKAASACRKMEPHFNQIEREEHPGDDNNIVKEGEHTSETPAIVPATRQRGLKNTHTCSTRRSARLAGKRRENFVASKEVKEGSKSLTTEFLSSEFGEIMEMNRQPQECPAAESLPVTKSPSGVDLKEKSELGLLDTGYEPEVLSGTKSGCSAESRNDFPILCDEHGAETSEIGNSKMTVECDNGSNELYCNKTEDAFENGEGLDIINDEMGCSDVAAEDVAQVIDTDDVRTIEDVADLKMKSEEELLESNKDFGSSDKTNASFDNENGKKLNVAKEMESEDDAAQNLVDEGKDLRSDDLDALNINDGAVESNESGGERAVGIITTPAAQESGAELSAFADDLAEKLVAMELDASALDEYKNCARLGSEMSWAEAAADVQLELEPPCLAEEECRRSMCMLDYNAANLDITDDGAREELKNYDRAIDDDAPLCYYSTAPLLLTADVVGTGVGAPVLPCITEVSEENLSNDVVQTSCLTTSIPMMEESATPSKSTATQLKISVTKKTPRQVTVTAAPVSDDKENMIIHNSGTRLIAAEEKKKGQRQTRLENAEKPLDEQSLRQLTKMLKEKLEITKKMSMTKDDDSSKSKAAPTGSESRRRLALQTLPENRLE
ncbi:unnamed protein product [Coffea canephora]|uniref:Uncharacterized protein n=1 Tax=Coffea canephora TaxID=49390 RepID=A0A068U8W1_COFCA|nr:unnamed protein product [Coffea canephora]